MQESFWQHVKEVIKGDHLTWGSFFNRTFNPFTYDSVDWIVLGIVILIGAFLFY